MNDPYKEAIALVGIAQIYRFQGKYAQAIEAFQQALVRARAGHNAQYEYFALNGLGNVYSDQANFPQAIKAYEKALQVSHQPDLKQSPLSELETLNNLGNIYKAQGNYTKALTNAQQLLEEGQKYYEQYARGITLYTIRAICLQFYTTANRAPEIQALASEPWTEFGYCTHPTQLPTGEMLKHFQARVADQVKLGRLIMALEFGSIGSIYSDRGEFQKALEFKQKELVIYREINDREREGEALEGISNTEQYLGNYPKALDFIQQALKIATEQGDLTNEIDYLSTLGAFKSDILTRQ